ncbi:IclR family transcriptional regulator [Murinocardiopsis flavida]|uniref:IclR family transcriptional regulator n=1 Tax=Murinocardiopsis flavida TaxID=645275 RepID=A0A2P8CXE5_9ACTN|nr:IclR family transcriptional regulator [Murinocardiopsis flavida]PSK89653.1 IclR family transcriptional regulator [Murinocardiopsis flavida]
MDPDSPSAKEHRTVTRITTILETVAGAEGGVRLRDVVDVLDAPKSSVYGLVQGLAAVGYLEEREGVYRMGPAVTMLLSPNRSALISAARPALEHLRRQFDETVTLAVRVGYSTVYLDSVESSRPIRYSAPLRQRRPLYPTSAGKCLLAFMPPNLRGSYLVSAVDEGERGAVVAELAQVREEGVAYNRGDTLPDVTAAGAIVLLGDRPVAAVACAGPTNRMAGGLDAVGRAVRSTADDIARRIS